MMSNSPVIYRGIKIEPIAGRRSPLARAIRDDLWKQQSGKKQRDQIVPLEGPKTPFGEELEKKIKILDKKIEELRDEFYYYRGRR